MRLERFLVWLVPACDPVLEDYYPPTEEAPVLSGFFTDPDVDLLGGQDLVLRGEHLETTRVVVFGTRNAEILERSADEVRVIVPYQAAFGSTVDLAVATDFGIARLEGGFTYETTAGSFDDDEVSSAALARLDCPIEGYATSGKRREALWWCGAEAGWLEGVGWEGVGVQEGAAGDLAEYGALATSPLPGGVRVFGPGERRPPILPVLADYHAVGDAIVLRTARDLDRDLDFIDEREALVEEEYSWAYGIDRWYGTIARLYDEEQCFLDRFEVVGSTVDTLALSPAPPPSATGLWLGFGFQETYPRDPVTYVTEAWTATAGITGVDGDTVTLADNELVLEYDDFTGYYFPVGVAGLQGQTDLAFDATYTVSTRRLGVEHVAGEVRGGEGLVVSRPNLMSGRASVALDRALVVEWEPVVEPGELDVVVLELFVYDLDVPDPNYQTEVYRVVATAWDADGRLVVPASVMEALPSAPNALDSDGVEAGNWGDVNVVRHQLRKVPGDGGDLVIDFLSVVNAPIRLERP